jgi:ribonuclease P protein component
VRTASLDVRAAASLHAFSRVGFVVPKYKHTGVERNRLKRRLREIVRLEVLPVLHADGTAQDLVLRVFPSAYGRDMATLRSEVLQAMRRLGG